MNRSLDRKLESMDRPIARRAIDIRSLAIAAVIIVIVVSGFIFFLAADSVGIAARVSAENLRISNVRHGVLDDFVPVRGVVAPIETQFLESLESGRIERMSAAEGEIVQTGDLIVELSNSALQLEVIGREADIAEQLNNISSSKLSYERNKLEHERRLLEINWNIDQLTREIERLNSLALRKLTGKAELDDVVRELDYWNSLLVATQAAQRTDEEMLDLQISQLDDIVKRLNENLDAAKASLEHLQVRAPIDGLISSLTVKTGEVLAKGDRIGQIDDTSSFKLTANVDEFYIDRINVGQFGVATISEADYSVTVDRTYPEVTAGAFRVDLLFTDTVPANVRRGQSAQVRLRLGAAENMLLLQSGPFYSTTGGHWVFVVSTDGQTAHRTNVELGRRNSEFIEVIGGLESGDRVIISSYETFESVDSLNIDARPQ